MPNHFLILLNWFCLLDPSLLSSGFSSMQICWACSKGLQQCFAAAPALFPGSLHDPEPSLLEGLTMNSLEKIQHHSHMQTPAALSFHGIHLLHSALSLSGTETSGGIRQHRVCSYLWTLHRRREIWWIFSLLALGSQSESSTQGKISNVKNKRKTQNWQPSGEITVHFHNFVFSLLAHH